MGAIIRRPRGLVGWLVGGHFVAWDASDAGGTCSLRQGCACESCPFHLWSQWGIRIEIFGGQRRQNLCHRCRRCAAGREKGKGGGASSVTSDMHEKLGAQAGKAVAMKQLHVYEKTIR